MAENKLYVNLNVQQNQLIDAQLTRAGVQTVTNLTNLNSLATTLQGLVETKRVLVFRADTTSFYVWDGGGGSGAFELVSGSATAGAMVFRGGLDASGPVSVVTTTITDTVDTYGSIKVGNTWVFTVGGSLPVDLGSHIVEVGDQLIFRGPIAGATADNTELTTAASWTVIQNNLSPATTTSAGYVELATDAETQTGTDTSRAITPSNLSSRTATETRTGIAEIATTAEVKTGTDDARIVTPLKLKGSIDARKVFSGALSLVAATPTDVTHNFTTDGYITNVGEVMVSVYDSTTKEEIGVSVIAAANKVTLESNVTITVDAVVTAI